MIIIYNNDYLSYYFEILQIHDKAFRYLIQYPFQINIVLKILSGVSKNGNEMCCVSLYLIND